MTIICLVSKKFIWHLTVWACVTLVVLPNLAVGQIQSIKPITAFNWKVEAEHLDTASYPQLIDSIHIKAEVLAVPELLECSIKTFFTQMGITDWHLENQSVNGYQGEARRRTDVTMKTGKIIENPSQMIFLSSELLDHHQYRRYISGSIGREMLYRLRSYPEILLRVTTFPYSDALEWTTRLHPKMLCTITLGSTYTLTMWDYEHSVLNRICGVGINNFMAASIELYKNLQANKIHSDSLQPVVRISDNYTDLSNLSTRLNKNNKKKKNNGLNYVDWVSKSPTAFIKRIAKILLPNSYMKSVHTEINMKKGQPNELDVSANLIYKGNEFELTYLDESRLCLQAFEKQPKPKTSNPRVLIERFLDSNAFLELGLYAQDSVTVRPEGYLNIYIKDGHKEIYINGEIEMLHLVAEAISKVPSISQLIHKSRWSEEASCKE